MNKAKTTNEAIHLVEGTAAPLVSEELMASLRNVEILSTLNDEQLRCLSGLEAVDLAEGDYIVRQGEPPCFFWMLITGEIRIYQRLADGRDVTVATINSGTAFGELPLLSNTANPGSLVALKPSHLLRLTEEGFWSLMMTCPSVRKSILANMAMRMQKLQSVTVQQEKMAALGTLAAGLMHELNNPGAAASRATSQLRSNLLRLHELSAKFSQIELSTTQKHCMFELQDQVLAIKQPLMMNSLEQSDAEDALVEWMEAAHVENAWKLAPTLVGIGIDAAELECARTEFSEPLFSDALSWLEAMVSSMQLVGSIEESIGRVSDLVHAVKAYAYEGKGQRQDLDVNLSIHATLVMLGYKMREKQIILEKDLAADLPLLHTECSGLNQIWTNLLDNAIDAVSQNGTIRVKTWVEKATLDKNNPRTDLCVSVTDNGSGIPLESQAHIFDPFYTTKAAGVGTGLGLGIVHRIVEQFGGIVRFTSDANGTTFLVRLPAPDA